jgi:predicted Zn-dependent protease
MDQNTALKLLDKDLRQVCSTAMGRRAFLILAPVLVAGCASGEKTRYREGDNSGQATSMTVADEKRMTKEYLPQMYKEYPRSKNKYAQSYISDLGRKIAAGSGMEGKP